jgi:hypothetical protein
VCVSSNAHVQLLGIYRGGGEELMQWLITSISSRTYVLLLELPMNLAEALEVGQRPALMQAAFRVAVCVCVCLHVVAFTGTNN